MDTILRQLDVIHKLSMVYRNLYRNINLSLLLSLPCPHFFGI